MSTEGTRRSELVPEETRAVESSRRGREGVGAFRALILTFLFYAALGLVTWFAWHAWKHWHLH